MSGYVQINIVDDFPNIYRLRFRLFKFNLYVNVLVSYVNIVLPTTIRVNGRVLLLSVQYVGSNRWLGSRVMGRFQFR